jgi:hypothetical protein
MAKLFSISVYLLAMVLVWGCEEIPVELADPVIPKSDRVVIIEDLSGASCPNCPKGNTAIENILNKFPGRVAAVAIHGDFLSKPTSKSKYDFRNPKARDLENWFKPWFGKPSASINRVPDENDIIMIGIPDLWQSAVEKELQKPHVMNIIPEIKYNRNTRKVDLEIAAIPLQNLDGNYNISVFITESNIIDAQTNGPAIIENYNHKHILRDMMTKFDGDAFGTSLKKNDIIRRSYSYTLPSTTDGLWVPENLEIVISIHKNEAKDKSVAQAYYSKLVK